MTAAVRALTLHQPYASLVAVGAKSIETRSWRTDYAECPVCEGCGVCDPVPAKGRQGLWDWQPEKVAA